MSEGNIRVLYNACYGGFSISERAIEEINKRKDTRLRSKYALNEVENRSDPVVLEVFDLLGSDGFSGKYAKIRAHTIEAKYLDYTVISEYDGLETVDVNMYNYNIHSVLSSTEITDEEKVKKLKEIFGIGEDGKRIILHRDQQTVDQVVDQQIV